MSAIRRNSKCPCGSDLKFKHCCHKKVDWESLSKKPLREVSRHLTIRGKNQQFLLGIGDALGATRFKCITDLKKVVTPSAVRKIHLLIEDLWPDLSDFERAAEADHERVTAFYTGSYEPRDVLKSITRLSLYTDKIILVDPFIRFGFAGSGENPIESPEMFRASTLKFLLLWFELWPWIDADIVSFVRPLHDFIPGLWTEIVKAQVKMRDENPEVSKLIKESADRALSKLSPTDNSMGELFFLKKSDSELLGILESSKTLEKIDRVEFIEQINERRQLNPLYFDKIPGQKGEFFIESSGACYELSKKMCSATNSHIVTNSRSRWKEVEIDRAQSGIDDSGWSPFAKALQESEFKLLDDVPLEAALTLRQERRLEPMRLFMRKIWKSCKNPDEFSEVNALDLSAELQEEVAQANEEWQKIDRDLLKFFAGSTGTLATLVSAGTVGFMSAGIGTVSSGALNLMNARMKRSSHKSLYPAGFFIGKKK